MKPCEKCGMLIPRGHLCQTCQKYKRNGGVWHPLPPYGEVHYDEEGRPICHICGMALDKLIEHTKRKHGLDAEAYREAFGLFRGRTTVRLTSPKYANKMRDYCEANQTHVKNFADVHEGRKPNGRRNPHWSPQEVERRRAEQSEKSKIRWAKMTPEERARLEPIWTKNLPNKKKEKENATD